MEAVSLRKIEIFSASLPLNNKSSLKSDSKEKDDLMSHRDIGMVLEFKKLGSVVFSQTYKVKRA